MLITFDPKFWTLQRMTLCIMVRHFTTDQKTGTSHLAILAPNGDAASLISTINN